MCGVLALPGNIKSFALLKCEWKKKTWLMSCTFTNGPTAVSLFFFFHVDMKKAPGWRVWFCLMFTRTSIRTNTTALKTPVPDFILSLPCFTPALQIHLRYHNKNVEAWSHQTGSLWAELWEQTRFLSLNKRRPRCSVGCCCGPNHFAPVLCNT